MKIWHWHLIHKRLCKNHNICLAVRDRLQDHPHFGVVCGPHSTVRTAPALKAQKLPHNHNFPTIHFKLFIQFLDKKIFKKDFKNFFQNIEKKHTNELCGWCAGADNTTSGVARGVAGVAEATPIIQFLFNKFGQKIRVKRYRIYCGLHQFQNPTYLPAGLLSETHQ